MFYFDEIRGKKVLRSDFLVGVDVFFTTREFCLFSKSEDMQANKNLLNKYLKEVPATNQPVHGTNIEKVVASKRYYEATDGLMLHKSGAAFMNFADCVPLILSTGGNVILSHAGWRGTAKAMAKVSLMKLIEVSNEAVENVSVVIGPAICLSCYEVGKDVYDALYKTVLEKRGLFREKDGRYFVDLKAINRQQLIEAGIKKIDVCPYCTACGDKLFFSYRYEHTDRRHSAVVKL